MSFIEIQLPFVVAQIVNHIAFYGVLLVFGVYLVLRTSSPIIMAIAYSMFANALTSGAYQSVYKHTVTQSDTHNAALFQPVEDEYTLEQEMVRKMAPIRKSRESAPDTLVPYTATNALSGFPAIL